MVVHTKEQASPLAPNERPCSEEPLVRGLTTAPGASISIENTTTQTVTLFSIDYNGRRRQYHVLEPASSFHEATFIGQPWLLATRAGDCVQPFYAPATVTLGSESHGSASTAPPGAAIAAAEGRAPTRAAFEHVAPPERSVSATPTPETVSAADPRRLPRVTMEGSLAQAFDISDCRVDVRVTCRLTYRGHLPMPEAIYFQGYGTANEMLGPTLLYRLRGSRPEGRPSWSWEPKERTRRARESCLRDRGLAVNRIAWRGVLR